MDKALYTRSLTTKIHEIHQGAFGYTRCGRSKDAAGQFMGVGDPWAGVTSGRRDGQMRSRDKRTMAVEGAAVIRAEQVRRRQIYDRCGCGGRLVWVWVWA